MINAQGQLFQIANLIFTKSCNQEISLNDYEVKLIHDRFLEITQSFEGSKSTHYATNFIKQGCSNLPYNSMTVLGKINNRLILHFTTSYKKPLMFVIDIEERKIKNNIDIESAKIILNDESFQDIKETLHFPKNLDRLFKGIGDMNKFINIYEQLLEENINGDTLTGRNCFEIDIGDLEL